MRLQRAILSAAALTLPLAAVPASSQTFSQFAVATPQPITGLYIGGGAGLNLSQTTALEARSTLGAQFDSFGVGRRGNIGFEPGWVALGALGWGFGNGWRVEVEGNYRENDVDRMSGFAGTGIGGDASGTQRIYGVMGNALYDFRLPWFAWAQPYIGVGLGYTWRQWSSVATNTNAGQLTTSGTGGNFTWQAILGTSIPVQAVPGLAMTAEYRYLGRLGNSYDASIPAAGLGGQGDQLRGFMSHNHSFLVGARYALYQPRPAMAAAPAAAPRQELARTYLVFFDWNRADLTDRAREIIGNAASAHTSLRTTRIEVAGHADRSGSPQYNQALSMRRAQAVAGELERRGVSRSAMSIEAFGESRPLVATADGVREPQNRRVEIVLR